MRTNEFSLENLSGQVSGAAFASEQRHKVGGICCIPAANSPALQAAAPTGRAEPLSLGVYDPEKEKEKRQENQNTEANAGIAGPPGTAHRAAPP